MKQLHLTTLCVHFCTLQIFIAHLDFCIQNTQAALSKAPAVTAEQPLACSGAEAGSEYCCVHHPA